MEVVVVDVGSKVLKAGFAIPDQAPAMPCMLSCYESIHFPGSQLLKVLKIISPNSSSSRSSHTGKINPTLLILLDYSPILTFVSFFRRIIAYNSNNKQIDHQSSIRESEHANFRLCNVSGYVTDLLEIHAEEPTLHILFVLGNPDATNPNEADARRWIGNQCIII